MRGPIRHLRGPIRAAKYSCEHYKLFLYLEGKNMLNMSINKADKLLLSVISLYHKYDNMTGSVLTRTKL